MKGFKAFFRSLFSFSSSRFLLSISLILSLSAFLSAEDFNKVISTPKSVDPAVILVQIIAVASVVISLAVGYYIGKLSVKDEKEIQPLPKTIGINEYDLKIIIANKLADEAYKNGRATEIALNLSEELKALKTKYEPEDKE